MQSTSDNHASSHAYADMHFLPTCKIWREEGANSLRSCRKAVKRQFSPSRFGLMLHEPCGRFVPKLQDVFYRCPSTSEKYLRHAAALGTWGRSSWSSSVTLVPHHEAEVRSPTLCADRLLRVEGKRLKICVGVVVRLARHCDSSVTRTRRIIRTLGSHHCSTCRSCNSARIDMEICMHATKVCSNMPAKLEHYRTRGSGGTRRRAPAVRTLGS